MLWKCVILVSTAMLYNVWTKLPDWDIGLRLYLYDHRTGALRTLRTDARSVPHSVRRYVHHAPYAWHANLEPNPPKPWHAPLEKYAPPHTQSLADHAQFHTPPHAPPPHAIPQYTHYNVTIITHGYTGSAGDNWVTEMAKAVQPRGGTVLVLDHYHLTALSRPAMNRHIQRAARHLADICDALVGAGITSPEGIHLIGFSLGNRILGGVSDYMETGRVGRITALDPSSPWPGVVGGPVLTSSDELDEGDARHVTILLTSVVSARVVGRGAVGRGVRAVLANGGRNQPGCWGPKAVIDMCGHYRVLVLALEALSRPAATLRVLQCPGAVGALPVGSGASSDVGGVDFCDVSVANEVAVNILADDMPEGLYHLITASENPFLPWL